MEVIDNNAGVRRQSPQIRGQRGLIGADFQELGKFLKKKTKKRMFRHILIRTFA